MNQADVIEFAIAIDERVMALQTANGVFPVARPSIVRDWYSNDYSTGSAVLYSNRYTNAIGHRTDHAMMVELDTKLKAIVPYYVDTNTYQPLTFTGLLASLNLGDGTNFTRTPAIGTNAATYGELPWRIYVQDLQERYKVLNALQWASNSYMWCSNQTIYVWQQQTNATGLSPRWRGTSRFSSGIFQMSTYNELDWDAIREHYEDDWFSEQTNSSSGPRSYTAAARSFQDWELYYKFWWHVQMIAVQSAYEIGPFPTNMPHSVLVEARSLTVPNDPFEYYEFSKGTSEWTSVGAIGAENGWVEIITATNSVSEWHYSSLFGDLSQPSWCEEPYTNGWSNGKGNYSEVRYSAWFGDPSRWVLNGTALTNTAFGTNSQFYYATNKYW